jgi:hypothetical protein
MVSPVRYRAAHPPSWLICAGTSQQTSKRFEATIEVTLPPLLQCSALFVRVAAASLWLVDAPAVVPHTGSTAYTAARMSKISL